MRNYEIAENYRIKQLQTIEGTLRKVSELIAFIRVYGSMFDDNYIAYVLNLNNISERFIQNFDSATIDDLYDTYLRLKQQTNTQEIYEELRLKMQKLPAYMIVESSARQYRKI